MGSADSPVTNADITQHVIVMRGECDKMMYLEGEIFPILQRDGGSALIFTRTKKVASVFVSTFHRAGAPIVCLHGDLEQRERGHALWEFKQGRVKVFVATDMEQRGLDIKNVGMVINYEPAANMEDYVHRFGHAGRAGEKSDAHTLLCTRTTGRRRSRSRR